MYITGVHEITYGSFLFNSLKLFNRILVNLSINIKTILTLSLVSYGTTCNTLWIDLQVIGPNCGTTSYLGGHIICIPHYTIMYI